MRSEELNTIKYVIKNFNLLKTQFHILHSYRIADYIEGKVDFLDKYNMSDFISLIEKLSYIFSMYHNDKTNKIIMHTLQGENIRKITETLCVSNHTVLDSQNEFYNYVLANVRSL